MASSLGRRAATSELSNFEAVAGSAQVGLDVARRYVATSSRICDVIASLPVMSSIASPITVTSSSESWAFQGVSFRHFASPDDGNTS